MAAAPAGQPTALELMAQRNKGMHSARSVAHGQGFKPRPTDVFVTTYPKCGTTWVTQVCHLLRCGGDIVDFDEISVLVPWDIMALDCGQDLDAEQVGNPRIFKSHEPSSTIARGAKYIHVCRRPEDAFISFYRFLPAFDALPPGAVTVEEFAEAIFGGLSQAGGIWDFFMSWWERRCDPDVLWICYEDLRDNLEEQVRRIADFMGVPLSQELLDKVLERSSFKYMEARSSQFDEHFVFAKVRDQMGIPPDYVFGDVACSKVRAGGGTTGEGKALPDHVAKLLADRWELSVASKTGLRSYEDLRKAVAELHAKK